MRWCEALQTSSYANTVNPRTPTLCRKNASILISVARNYTGRF